MSEQFQGVPVECGVFLFNFFLTRRPSRFLLCTGSSAQISLKFEISQRKVEAEQVKRAGTNGA